MVFSFFKMFNIADVLNKMNKLIDMLYDCLILCRIIYTHVY